jgi:transcription-repair coupling factor (superfamily II helicase)
MLIDHVANQLLSVSDMREVLTSLRKGEDASVGVAQSARPLLAASLWADDPRPCLLVVPGEEAADRMARSVAAWLGNNAVMRYPQRADWPWSNKAADDSIVGARCAAMERLAAGEPCVVVASARSLMRRVPPVGTGYFCSSTFAVGDEAEFDDEVADHIIRIPKISEMLMPMVATVPMQLLAYYTSVNKGNDVDKPRNLAKSVTVE